MQVFRILIITICWYGQISIKLIKSGQVSGQAFYIPSVSHKYPFYLIQHDLEGLVLHSNAINMPSNRALPMGKLTPIPRPVLGRLLIILTTC